MINQQFQQQTLSAEYMSQFAQPNPIKKISECHFYQKGHCHRGLSCQFSHIGIPRGYCLTHCLMCQEIKSKQKPTNQFQEIPKTAINISQTHKRKENQNQSKKQKSKNPQNFMQVTNQNMQNFVNNQVLQHPQNSNFIFSEIPQRPDKPRSKKYGPKPIVNEISQFEDQNKRIDLPINPMNWIKLETNQTIQRTQRSERRPRAPNKIQPSIEEKFSELSLDIFGFAEEVSKPKESTLKEEKDVDKACALCLNFKRDHAFVPCGHRILCGSCIKNSNMLQGKCPMCRANFTSIMKIYD